MQTLLIIENDTKLEKEIHSYIFKFLKTFTGNVIEFTGFKSKTKEEIYKAVNEATDIFTETCFVNGSDYQFMEMVELLSKIKEPKNIYIAYIGSRYELFDYIDNNLTDEQLVSISQHSIFEYRYKEDYPEMESVKMDFSARVNAYLKKLQDAEDYRMSAQARPTGRKIKILACNAHGKAFETLQIGSIVDELDMSSYEAQDINRGVWIWGNGEPVKLVNDCGLIEYEIASEFDFDSFIDEVRKITGRDISTLSPMTIKGILSVLEDVSVSDMEAANLICEEVKIEKRFNREIIRKFINKLRQTVAA